jgi:hypothetical protein
MVDEATTTVEGEGLPHKQAPEWARFASGTFRRAFLGARRDLGRRRGLRRQRRRDSTTVECKGSEEGPIRPFRNFC